MTVMTLAKKRHLMRVDEAESLRVIVDEGLAVAKKGVAHDIPATTQFVGDLSDAASVLANLLSQPSTRPVGDEKSGKRNPNLDITPGPLRTAVIGAEEPELVPYDPCRTSVHRQVAERDLVAILHPCHHPRARDNQWPLADTRSGS